MGAWTSRIALLAAAVAFRLYGHDAEDNAWLITALGVGALIMSVYVLLVAARFRRTVLTKAGIAIYAVGLALISAFAPPRNVALRAYGRPSACDSALMASPIAAKISPPNLALYPELRNLKGGLQFAGVNGNRHVSTEASLTTFQPRVGAAYRLNEQTVLRGGYGMFYANWPISD